jgi:hypothetical protein
VSLGKDNPTVTLAESGTPPKYDDVIATYGLTILERPGDLQIENGDIALTKDNDLKLGDTAYNALFRLVQRWRFTAPTLRRMFREIYSIEPRITELESTAETAFTLATKFYVENPLNVDRTRMDRFHEIEDEIAGLDLAIESYAGSLLVIASGLLSRFKDDVDANEPVWTTVGPQIGGQSIGPIISAAANSFRHHDEWIKAKHPDRRQQKSMDILAAALGIHTSTLRRSLGPMFGREIIHCLSAGDFDEFHRKFFGFAHAVAVDWKTKNPLSEPKP